MKAEQLRDWFRNETGRRLVPDSGRSLSGGCIHDSRRYDCEDGDPVFVKVNRATRLPLFEAEAAGLRLLEESGAIRVPRVLGCGTVGDSSVLALEFIDLRPSLAPEEQARLGEQLARLHEHNAPDDRFGLDSDNFIGATPQTNIPCPSWTEFFLTRRLEYQLTLAGEKGLPIPDREKFLSRAAEILDAAPVSPALLHGDLWSGNAAFDSRGEPVLFDPAVHFGDRETDIAFTRMFGGFGPSFYEAYREVHPAGPDIESRHRLYNLYHELNHFHLFGGGYGTQALRTIEDLSK